VIELSHGLQQNEETKRIKAAFTLPRLNEAAQHVAKVIANKPPTQMPVVPMEITYMDTEEEY
jgi:hypothetical protein